MSLPENDVFYETIVITENSHINSAALSALRKGGYIYLRSFKGSNTFENLLRDRRFSVNYISHENKGIFIDAAVKGWGNEEQEIDESEIIIEPFPHLKKADGWALCQVENMRKERIRDEIGETEIMHVEARILFWEGSAENAIKVGEDRNIMALVAYTRFLISEGKVREKFRNMAMKLADRRDVVGRWVKKALLMEILK